jgi:hypothetical protein
VSGPAVGMAESANRSSYEGRFGRADRYASEEGGEDGAGASVMTRDDEHGNDS